ncbi:MAG: carboxymuconolactone decarboxylase family protein [Chloroflexi bacterium]|nr:carboxymuconolactone decarboxylase family protein [Chloroflexota bacterium]
MTELSERQQQLRESFINERGYWNQVWDGLLRLDPDFFEAYLNLSATPWRTGTLEPKIKEFIYIAIDAATTHLYAPGLRQHVQNALRLGATADEIMEVYELVSALGIHTCTMGVPILIEELRRAGRGAEVDGRPLSERQRQLKDSFVKERGYWNEFWDGLLLLDPDFFEAYLNFSATPWRKGRVAPKIKELIYIAIDAATTHLYAPGLRQHVRNAFGYGATKEEIMEVYELTSVLGIHTCAVGVPVLLSELAKVREGGG